MDMRTTQYSAQVLNKPGEVLLTRHEIDEKSGEIMRSEHVVCGRGAGVRTLFFNGRPLTEKEDGQRLKTLEDLKDWIRGISAQGINAMATDTTVMSNTLDKIVPTNDAALAYILMHSPELGRVEREHVTAQTYNDSTVGVEVRGVQFPANDAKYGVDVFKVLQGLIFVELALFVVSIYDANREGIAAGRP